jgi:hypothetical protein
MSTASIKIIYDLKPPGTVAHGDLAASKAHEFPVEVASNESNASGTAFYTALRRSLEAARNQVGDELTAWRDVVGKAELSKELKKVGDGDEEEEEEDEEEEV